ncbi:MAG: ATP synthase subunit c [Methanonatronarchaeales archaeon]|nr:ATP synthase subunit c [Methanonatronarchaeales archaeon]
MVEGELAQVSLYLGAALAVGIGALATAWSQTTIGPSAVGAMAEDPDLFGKGLLMTVIPETMVVFGLIVALIMLLVV